MALRQAVYICSAQRTACGAFGGSLKGFTATDLATTAAAAAIAKSGIPASAVDHVIVGNVAQTSSDAAYLARHVALRSGCSIETPGLTVNRLCGSGFESIIQGANQIRLGESDVVVAGGTESMSQAPHAARDLRWGTRLGVDPKLEDTLWSGLTDSLYKIPMGITAENLAEKYNISRDDCDQFALRSQKNWADAAQNKRFDAEICPVTIKSRKGEVQFLVDEHPKPATTMESLAKLPTVFKKNGTVTAASSSGICDGGSAVVLAGEEAAAKHGAKPLARIVGWATTGCEPTEMGIGPVSAVQKALAQTGLTLQDMDLIEVNEAFGAQALAVAKALEINMDRFNVDGGAIAIGHPLGMSGNRIMTHLTHELKRRGGRYAIGSACIGGGMGTAIIIENLA